MHYAAWSSWKTKKTVGAKIKSQPRHGVETKPQPAERVEPYRAHTRTKKASDPIDLSNPEPPNPSNEENEFQSSEGDESSDEITPKFDGQSTFEANPATSTSSTPLVVCSVCRRL